MPKIEREVRDERQSTKSLPERAREAEEQWHAEHDLNKGPVAQVEPVPKLRHTAFGGGDNDSWNCGVANGMAGALPAFHSPEFAEAARACLLGLRDIRPNDPVEGMLAAQIIAAHEASMHLRQLAWHPDQSFVVQTRYLELAEKAARTMAMLTERLDQHRSRGQQQITVRHVAVNAEQAAVADTVTTQGGPHLNGHRPHA
jgi:hypothetical protein